MFYDEIDEIVKKYPDLEYTVSRLKSKVDEKKKKEKEKNKAAEFKKDKKFSDLLDEVLVQLKSTIDKNADSYVEYRTNTIEKNYEYYKQIDHLDFRDPKKKQFYRMRGYRTIVDNFHLWMNKSRLKEYLKKERENYIKGEESKIEMLLFRTMSKLGAIDNVKVNEFRSKSLSITLDTEQEKGINVFLDAIGAGGYNVQRFHYRWLSYFVLNGKRYEFNTTKK
jgi:hypothetical protein